MREVQGFTCFFSLVIGKFWISTWWKLILRIFSIQKQIITARKAYINNQLLSILISSCWYILQTTDIFHCKSITTCALLMDVLFVPTVQTLDVRSTVLPLQLVRWTLSILKACCDDTCLFVKFLKKSFYSYFIS